MQCKTIINFTVYSPVFLSGHQLILLALQSGKDRIVQLNLAQLVLLAAQFTYNNAMHNLISTKPTENHKVHSFCSVHVWTSTAIWKGPNCATERAQLVLLWSRAFAQLVLLVLTEVLQQNLSQIHKLSDVCVQVGSYFMFYILCYVCVCGKLWKIILRMIRVPRKVVSLSAVYAKTPRSTSAPSPSLLCFVTNNYLTE